MHEKIPNTPFVCKADRKPQPHDWTYHAIAGLLEDMAPMTRAEKDALRMFVGEYADKVARKDGRETDVFIADILDAMADFMHGYAEQFRRTWAD